DYILTGPISGVSAGQYIMGLGLEIIERLGGSGFKIDPVLRKHWKDWGAVAICVLTTLYFFRQNLRGIHESSDKALKIMLITTVMGVIVIGWCGVTLATRGVATYEDPTTHEVQKTELPTQPDLHPTPHYSAGPALTPAADKRMPGYNDNLIGGLAMSVAGPDWARLLLNGFVVLVGFLILSGAVNTAIIGSNGVLNRVAEDGVLPDWFLKPHPKYGTTYRVLTLILILKLITIIASRGDVLLLGEAYAFGVVWSFVFMSASMVILRFKD